MGSPLPPRSADDQDRLARLPGDFARSLPWRVAAALPFGVAALLFAASNEAVGVALGLAAGVIAVGPLLMFFHLVRHRRRLERFIGEEQVRSDCTVEMGPVQFGIIYAARVWVDGREDERPRLVLVFGERNRRRHDGPAVLWGHPDSHRVAVLEVNGELLWPAFKALSLFSVRVLFGSAWVRSREVTGQCE